MSCEEPSSLKTPTSVLHPVKTKHIVHLIKKEKKNTFMQHLPLSLAKCLQELQEEIYVRLHSYNRNPPPTYPL